MQPGCLSGVGSGFAAHAAVDQDLQVKTLEAKIEDWSTCPTTDPQTKRAIVARLQSQLDAVTSSLEAKQGDSTESRANGLGQVLDLRA
ncbi:MAG TPA: hypothetical protein VMI31_08205 [Fimbriimonadaceae bacterium]|nr:hypothetical protein [Fimbriimonadaceae bacterium]